ncbi:peptidase M16 [Xanthomonas arboricola pv. populi]|uniref:Peptidase M16 n=1 Tax=Xanthomonas arboricola pv. populi TaxID=487823 RepID=A0A2S6Z7F4_9XANT|nr:pitrilysin family protein [Xanthomonas arboricola]PPT77556.1 peptidase M16 [Xanthomonas arboricola pv. populi]
MNRLLKSLVHLLLLACIAQAAAAAPEPPAGRIQIDHQAFTLPNGLTTLVHSDHSLPTVFVGVWYRVGSKDEPQGKTGFAHLFEHLMFQPTVNRSSEYFLPLNKAGASDMNGTTDVDRTKYYQTVPSNALDLALWMESDRMGYLGRSITQQVLDEQRAVVKNEKRQDELGGGDKTLEFYRQNFYPKGHPYAHSTIGSMEDLDRATLADVKQWFEDYYGASNAVLVLSGDIDVETARQKVAHYFADVPAGKPAARLEQWVPDFPQVKRDVIYGDGPTATVRRNWPLSNDDPRETTLLQLAAATLAGSRNTPLHELLVERMKLATRVSASVSKNHLTSTFGISATLAPGVAPERAGALIDQTLRDYFANGPQDKLRLQAIALGTDNALLRSLESNAAIGSMLAEGQLYANDPLFFVKQRQWVREASAEDLRAVVRKWLDRPYYESLLLPSPKTSDARGSVDRSRIPEPGEFKGQVRFPAIRETVLDNGMKLVVAERRGLPLVNASMQFDTGSDADAAYAPGIAEQAFRLLPLGTRKYDGNALVREIDRVGFYLNTAVGERRAGFNWSNTSDRLDDAFALAAELLRHPTYPQQEIDRRNAGADVDAYFDAYEHNPIDAASALFARALWGPDHPNGRITTREQGRREQAMQSSHDTLARFHDTELGPNNATLYVLGDVTLEKARALAERHFGDWRAASPTALPPSGPRVPPAAGARVILIDAPGAAQSSIVAGHLVAPFDKDTAAIESLMNAALGTSFHSRLNMNLREDKGWTYGFSAGVANAPTGPRVFAASGTLQTDRTAQGMLEIRKEIGNYVGTRPMTEAELERERDAAIRAIPAGFGNGGAFLASMISSRAYGLPYTRAEGAMQRLSEVSLEQVRQAARATYRPDQLTWVVAGDLKLIERDIRALGLGPVEVWDVYGNRVR